MKRVEWVDAVKAWTVFLVVLGHAIGAYVKDAFMYQVIYLFHMPLFFMVSGITFYLSTTGEGSDRGVSLGYLEHRLINLGIPAMFFTMVNICMRPARDIFYYYNGVWFLLHLSLILSVHYVVGKLRIKRAGTILVTGGWIMMGLLQLFLIRGNCLIAAKFACEISKWCGYYLMFNFGIYLYTHMELLQKRHARRIFLVSFIIIGVIAYTNGLQGNIALTRILAGCTGGGYMCMLFADRKRVYRVEKVLSLASLEIYLIHVNILHNMLIVPGMPYIEQLRLPVSICILLSTILYLTVPVGIYWLEKYIKPLKFIFHPISVLKERRQRG